MNSHDVRLHNKAVGHVVDPNKVKFVMSNVSCKAKWFCVQVLTNTRT